jgi:hypothetical protein
MKQGRIARVIGFALALAIIGAGAMAPRVQAAPRATASKPTSATATKKPATMHQFSGVVTAVDKTTLTVEKNGKSPKSMTFERHAGMSTQGNLERDVRVTVFYRDEDGRPVAHKVVVKDATAATGK